MTDHEHAATGPGPGSGPVPEAGGGPRDAVPGEGAAAPHRFRRDRRSKVLAGVCAGLGRQCDMDPVIFRITLAVLSATGGIGLIFYGFAWLFVPYDDEEENEVRKLFTGRVDGQALAAVLFALVGCGVFLSMLSNASVLTFAVVLSLLLAGAGYWSQQRGAPDPDPLAAQAVADAPPEAQAPPVVTSYPSWWRDPIVKDGTHVGGTGYLWGPGDSRDGDIEDVIDARLSPAYPHWREDQRIARPAPRSRAGRAGSAAGSSSSRSPRAPSAPPRSGTTRHSAPACRRASPVRSWCSVWGSRSARSSGGRGRARCSSRSSR